MQRRHYNAHPKLKQTINHIRKKHGKERAEETAEFVNALLNIGFQPKDIVFKWDNKYTKFEYVTVKHDTES